MTFSNHVPSSCQPPVDLGSVSKIQLSSSREATFRLRLACTAFNSSNRRTDQPCFKDRPTTEDRPVGSCGCRLLSLYISSSLASSSGQSVSKLFLLPEWGGRTLFLVARVLLLRLIFIQRRKKRDLHLVVAIAIFDYNVQGLVLRVFLQRCH